MNEVMDEEFQEGSIPEWLLFMGSQREEVDPRNRFNNELESLLNWLSLSKLEMKLRRSIFDEVKGIVNTCLNNCKTEMMGSYYTGMMLPDSNIDIAIVSNNIQADTTKIIQALTVSMKYEEILSDTKDSSKGTIDFKHIYSGIPVHLELAPSWDINFSNFIRYAKRVKGYKSLYLIFRYFLKQYNISCDSVQKQIIHLLIIYYLQIILDGHTESLLISDMFVTLLDKIEKTHLLDPSVQHGGFTFIKYLASVEQKLGLQFDLKSKSLSRFFKRIKVVCENASKSLQFLLNQSQSTTPISSAIFHNIPRIPKTMRVSFFYTNLQKQAEVYQYSHDNQKDETTAKIIVVLLLLLVITFIAILILLYLKYKVTSGAAQTPQIVLGKFIEQREIAI